MLTFLRLAVCALTITGLVAGQTKKGASTKQPAAAKAGEPKWKAIWEPVPFNKDIQLNSISCTGPETCWVAGDKGTILLTSDGGKTWQTQLGGDPEATDDALLEVVFLDSTHGWVKANRSDVMGTTDGKTWAALSKLPSTARALWFTTPQLGLAADNHDSLDRSMLNATQDGGKTWTRGQPCSVDAVVGGLARKLGCHVQHIQFVSPAIGFMGGGAPIGNAIYTAAFAKTNDGGATWAYSTIPETKHALEKVMFWSEKDGLALLASGQTYWTADAGATWTGSANSPSWRTHYASGEGKILVGVNRTGQQIGYSFNGGRSFSSRPANLPTEVNAVTFPDARHGYLVGRHGMVYRYRIVPFEYTAAGMFGAAAPQ
ncbi:MAG: hypothetical protein JJE04_25620 [Acidobacteriia bacterium]|nr:hypothetical protein [Terriglobia bacterium]